MKEKSKLVALKTWKFKEKSSNEKLQLCELNFQSQESVLCREMFVVCVHVWEYSTMKKFLNEIEMEKLSLVSMFLICFLTSITTSSFFVSVNNWK